MCREIPNTRTQKELGAGDTERRSGVYQNVHENSSTGSTTRNLSAFGYTLKKNGFFNKKQQNTTFELIYIYFEKCYKLFSLHTH
jgi:hypothetical protein